MSSSPLTDVPATGWRPPRPAGWRLTRSLVWKEVRELWVVWLVLVFAAAAGVAGASQLFYAVPGRDEPLIAVLSLAAWAYGLVCGAHLFAGEAEGATQGFLDTLPVTRRRLWRAKAGAGLALVATQVTALAVVGRLLYPRNAYDPYAPLAELPVVLLLAGTGYAWGMYSGSFGRNVLGAVARAVASQVVTMLAVGMGVTLLAYFGWFPKESEGALLPVLVGLPAAGAALRSRTIYCRPDRLRHAPPGSQAGFRSWLARQGESFGRAGREARWFAVGMAVYGVVGMAVVAILGAAAWPVWTLVLGVLCGVTVVAGERGWLARACVRYAVGLAAAGITTLVVLLPILARMDLVLPEGNDPFRTRVPFSAVSALDTNPWLFLTFWLTAGFASGLYASALVRNRLVAAATGLLLACLGGGIWLPTVYVAGELHPWHMLAAPAILLAAAALLAIARGAGRLTTVGLVGIAVCTFLAAALATATGLRYRAYEMPQAPDAVDVEAFVASLPGPQDNAAGRLTSNALLRLEQIRGTPDDDGEANPHPPEPGRRVPSVPAYFRYLGQAADVNTRGWTAGDQSLGRYLDKLFDATWDHDLAETANHPTGRVEDPRIRTLATPLRGFFSAREAAFFLSARGLERQDGGKPEVFVDNLRTGLALARNLRLTPLASVPHDATSVEWITAVGVECWLERLDGRPDLLRSALTTLTHHPESPRPDPDGQRATRLLIVLNSLPNLADVPRNGNGADPFFSTAPNETPVLQFALAAPWEKFRLRRVLDGLASDDPELQKLALGLTPPALKASFAGLSGLIDFFPQPPHPGRLYPVRVAALQVALRLYQAEVGRPAEQLTDLVPKYLPAIPLDPYDGQPFRYRLSRGEFLDWPPPDYEWDSGKPYDPRRVPAGQGILWSVGRDGHDDGGHAQELPQDSPPERPADRIFLVPLPPGRP
jgi:hypothetical protein